MENVVALMVCMYTGPLLCLNNTLGSEFVNHKKMDSDARFRVPWSKPALNSK